MPRHILIALLWVAMSPALLCGQAAQPSSASRQLQQLLDRVWDFRLVESPMLATDVGDPRGQDQLSDMSLQAIQRRVETQRGFLAELQRIDPSELPLMEKIDHELLRRNLQNQLANDRFKTHLMPLSNRGGFHISFPELPRIMNPKTDTDFKNYIARLNAFEKYTNDHISLLRAGMAIGLTQPAISMRDSPKQVAALIVDDPAQSFLYTKLSDEAKTRLQQPKWQSQQDELLTAIRDKVLPSYRRLHDFLENEYLPACRGEVGASSLPDGRAFYRERVRRFTTLDLSPEEVHQTGIRENAKIRAEMESIRKQVGFEGDLPAFLKHLRTDPKYYAETKEELLKFVAGILKAADGRLPELFGHLPRIPYGLREVPDYVAPQTSSAYYWPPPTDGSRAGFFYINTYNLPSRPLFQMEALSMHEAVPGHHLQLALQAEIQDLHPMSRQSSFTAFIEGWGLYSEKLGKEMGFYKDPYQDFGRLSMEAWRASRLVVDTGIHWMGWSRQQAITYMRENTALSEHNIVSEVDRYIGWPGQALAYKIGEITISRLRKEAEAALGDKFDVRSFHDRVLESGSIPLPLLEQRVAAWITEQQKKQ